MLQAVLQFKWDTFAGKWVRFEFLTFVAWLVSFSVFMLLFQVGCAVQLCQQSKMADGDSPACCRCLQAAADLTVYDSLAVNSICNCAVAVYLQLSCRCGLSCCDSCMPNASDA